MPQKASHSVMTPSAPTQSVLPFLSGVQGTATHPVRHTPRLMDQVRQALGRHHHSIKAEQAVVYWVKFFVRWHGMRHPQELGSREVAAFLTMLRQRTDLPPASWSQAANALTFLYREVLGRAMTTPDPEQLPTSRSARQRAYPSLADWDWFGANSKKH